VWRAPTPLGIWDSSRAREGSPRRRPSGYPTVSGRSPTTLTQHALIWPPSPPRSRRGATRTRGAARGHARAPRPRETRARPPGREGLSLRESAGDRPADPKTLERITEEPRTVGRGGRGREISHPVRLAGRQPGRPAGGHSERLAAHHPGRLAARPPVRQIGRRPKGLRGCHPEGHSELRAGPQPGRLAARHPLGLPGRAAPGGRAGPCPGPVGRHGPRRRAEYRS
jgi:hypothetical protein